MNIKISPSILAADFGYLADEIERVNKTDADYLHIDVMDGSFVPNISFGQPVLKFIKQHSKKPLDVHLMIDNPHLYIDDFASLGSDIITFHIEAVNHADRVIQQIKNHNLKAGISLNPQTHPSLIEYLLDKLDLILIMTVNPGFGGQKFISNQLEKIKLVNTMVNKINKDIMISVDGGVDNTTHKKIIEAGANMLVAGSYIFNGEKTIDGYQKKIDSLKTLK